MSLLNIKMLNEYLLNEKLILEDISLVENLPQVGSKIFDYMFNYDNQTFIYDKIYENILIDYIITSDYDFLIGKGHFKLNKKAHKLISAGRIKFNNGKINHIDNDSGHYNPPYEHLEYISKVFTNLNCVENLTISNIDNQLHSC